MEDSLPPLPDANDVRTPAAAPRGDAINYPIPIPAASKEPRAGSEYPIPDIDISDGDDDGTAAPAAAGPLSPNSPIPDISDGDVGTAASAAAGPSTPNSDDRFLNFLATTPEYDGDGGGAGDKSPLDFEGLESFTGVAEDKDAAAANTLLKINRNPSVGSGGAAAKFDAEEFPVKVVKKRGAAEANKPRRVKGKRMQNFTTFDPKKQPMQVLNDLREILNERTIDDVSQCTVHSLQEPKTEADKQVVRKLKLKHKRTVQNYILAGISGKSNPTGYFGGYDLNLKGLLDIIAGGYPAHGITLDDILADIKRNITRITRDSRDLCTRLGIPGACSTEMPVENKFPPTTDALPDRDRAAVGLDFVETAGNISYLIDVSSGNTILVRNDTGEFHLRVIDNSRFRCPDKADDFSMNSFLPKKQATINRIVSDSYKPAQASYSDILTGAEAFYIYEHYFTALKTAIEFVTDRKIQFNDDVDAATTAYQEALLVDPKTYTLDLQKLRHNYGKKFPDTYTSNAEFIREKQDLDARALGDVAGLRYTALLTAAVDSGVYNDDIGSTLRALYEKSVGAFCTGVGREVPQMPISMFASFADLCV